MGYQRRVHGENSNSSLTENKMKFTLALASLVFIVLASAHEAEDSKNSELAESANNVESADVELLRIGREAGRKDRRKASKRGKKEEKERRKNQRREKRQRRERNQRKIGETRRSKETMKNFSAVATRILEKKFARRMIPKYVLQDLLYVTNPHHQLQHLFVHQHQLVLLPQDVRQN